MSDVSQQLSGGPDLEATQSAKTKIRQLARDRAIQQASDLDVFMDHHQKRSVTLEKNRAHPSGSPPCQLRNTASDSIKVMLKVAKEEALQFKGTTRFEILLPLILQKCVTMWPLNPNFSHWTKRLSNIDRLIQTQ